MHQTALYDELIGHFARPHKKTTSLKIHTECGFYGCNVIYLKWHNTPLSHLFKVERYICPPSIKYHHLLEP